MSICLNCKTSTSNPKFCSRSCAASFNNKRPGVNRRKPEGSCRDCSQPIHSSRLYCKSCRTKKLVTRTENSNLGRNPYVRNHARKLYIAAGRPLFCALCRYSTHVDICHIKDVRSYPVGTLYAVVNSQENILALCKNHHWEFDHDVL
jgi:hypothetical protein